MSKVKSKTKIPKKQVRMEDEEMDTSDDDYIDPKIEKYFKDTKFDTNLNGKDSKKAGKKKLKMKMKIMRI